MITYNRIMTIDEFKIGNYEHNCYEDLLVETTPIDIVKYYSIDGYQGETVCLLFNRITYKLGYLIFSWGSCGGCDAYQSCYGDVDCFLEVRNSLFESIVWFDTKEEALIFFNKDNERWQTQYYQMAIVDLDEITDIIKKFENKYITK